MTDSDALIHIHSIEVLLVRASQSSVGGVKEAANISGAWVWKYRKLATDLASR